jgi:hypothetical protein
MGIPEGLGVFCPSSSLFVTRILSSILAPHAFKLDKILISKCKGIYGTLHWKKIEPIIGNTGKHAGMPGLLQDGVGSARFGPGFKPRAVLHAESSGSVPAQAAQHIFRFRFKGGIPLQGCGQRN